jgi:outer membrane murein-binding lipoprotein Lpp
MSEDKKPKIDLKARLGKKTVSAPATGPGGSIPPPAGIPKPSGVGIPAPPFQPSHTSRPAPMVDASNPYGAMEPSVAPRAEPATIRIEMGDDVMRAQKGGKAKVLVLAIVTAAIGGFVGFTLGGGAERAKGQEAALQGAQDLTKEVQAANTKIEELANVLKAAKEKLGKGKFPDEEVSKLGALNIPFDGTNLSGKGIGRFKSEVLNMLIQFASASTEANDQKEKIQNVLNRNKKGVQEFLDGQTKPVIRWSVMVSGSPFGPIASMQPVPTPFMVQSDDKKPWPESFKLMADKKEVTVKRYLKGDAATEDPTFIPVDPGTQTLVCPNDTLFSIRRELSGMEEVLRGNPTPGEEKTGLLEQGQNLLKKLKDIGKAAG